MPLHDWNNDSDWGAVHIYWITELGRWLKARLPAGYRSFIGTSPVLTIDAPGRPDVGVRKEPKTEDKVLPSTNGVHEETEYGEERVATVTLAPSRYVYVEFHGRLVAAIEIISPANKDRPSKREAATRRYAGYLHNGIHLMVIDVLPKPRGFSFADSIAEELTIPDEPACPTPMVVSYHVGDRLVSGETHIGIRSRSLVVGQPLPTLPLWLTDKLSVAVDLESTYAVAASDEYLE